MSFSFGGLGDILKQAQKMKEEVSRIQEEAAKKTVETSAGGGMVKVTANGRGQIVSIVLDPDLLKMNDKEMTQDLITAAVNQAITASQEMLGEEMRRLTAGLGPLASMLKGMG